MKKLLIIIIIFFSILMISMGCRWYKGIQYRIYITGQVYDSGRTYALVSFAPIIPWVTINKDTLDLRSYDYEYFTYEIYYEDSITVDAGDSVFLKVDFIRGIATASTMVPGAFEITSHDTSQIVQVSDDSILSIDWTSAEYANFYKVLFRLWRNYESGFSIILVHMDTCITSTSINFDMNEYLPWNVDSAANIEGRFAVYAYSGPIIEIGSEGNVKGDGSGYLWCETFGGDFKIKVKGTGSSISEEIPVEEERMSWFEKVRMIDPEFQILKNFYQR